MFWLSEVKKAYIQSQGQSGVGIGIRPASSYWLACYTHKPYACRYRLAVTTDKLHRLITSVQANLADISVCRDWLADTTDRPRSLITTAQANLAIQQTKEICEKSTTHSTAYYKCHL